MEKELGLLARNLVAPGKGLLAADESISTIKKRFDSNGIENTEANRRDYRELLFKSEHAPEFISGVILHDETIRQKDSEGKTMATILEERRMIPGIKVDSGAHELAGFPGEKITEGLDGLRGRLKEYYNMGARFAKWRAVINIGSAIPTDTCLAANAQALGRYAALCQEQQMVPIVEPEVIMEGIHGIERCFEVTEHALHRVFERLFVNRVLLEGMLLKPNMILSGRGSQEQTNAETVAKMTLACLYRSVPAAVPGIVFLSGGQTEQQATEHLNAMNSTGTNHPWQLSFSYGRALQATALAQWQGHPENRDAASKAFIHRARLNSMATLGKYQTRMESDTESFS